MCVCVWKKEVTCKQHPPTPYLDIALVVRQGILVVTHGGGILVLLAPQLGNLEAQVGCSLCGRGGAVQRKERQREN